MGEWITIFFLCNCISCHYIWKCKDLNSIGLIISQHFQAIYICAIYFLVVFLFSALFWVGLHILAVERQSTKIYHVVFFPFLNEILLWDCSLCRELISPEDKAAKKVYSYDSFLLFFYTFLATIDGMFIFADRYNWNVTEYKERTNLCYWMCIILFLVEFEGYNEREKSILRKSLEASR